MIFAILAAYWGYKKAVAAQKNGWLWALITAGTFIGTQLIVTFGGGILLGLGIELLDWSDNLLDTLALPITVVAVIASFISMWAVLKYLDRAPQTDTFIAPPPPPTFND
jgi:cytochrome bd-type quinol oxidase subunit 2